MFERGNSQRKGILAREWGPLEGNPREGQKSSRGKWVLSREILERDRNPHEGSGSSRGKWLVLSRISPKFFLNFGSFLLLRGEYYTCI
jgi:hypothetical protein